MKKLKTALTAVEDKLGLNERLLRKARKRHKKFRELAERETARQVEAHESADADHKEASAGNFFGSVSTSWERRARRFERRAIRFHHKSQYWLRKIKIEVRRVKKLKVDQKTTQAEMAKLGATVEGNEVTGGTPRERWLLFWLTAVDNCAKGIRRNFYSMSGAWDILCELVGGPKFGSRSDCSSTVAGGIKAVGLPDINGTGFTSGWTETMLEQHNGWKIVSREAMHKKGWGAIVYLRFPGDKEGHHTEAFTPTDSEPELTSGHGSDPVDHGTEDLFGDGLYACLIHER